MSGRRAPFAAAALALAAVLIALPAEAAAPVMHVRLEGVVNPIEARHVKASLERARSEGARLVVLSIDTPGGLVTSMQEIVSSIVNSKVPVVGLVEPSAAQATSAGALILLATDVAAMLPGTRMGAAHPVGAEGNLQGDVKEKATNDMVSLAKSLAIRRGRPAPFAEGLVRESKSYTAEEAKEQKGIDLVVKNRDDLLSRLDGFALDFPDRKVVLRTRGAARIDLPMSAANRVLDALAEPTIASILLTLGVLGILYELSTPGIGVGGIAGLSCLFVGLLGMSALPLELAGILLVTAGVLAIAVETQVPTHGLLGGGGIVALLLGALVLVDEASYFGSPQRVDWRLFVPVGVFSGVLFLALGRLAAGALRAPLASGVETLAGKRGTAKSAFVRTGEIFAGTAFVDGARWQGISETEIASGGDLLVLEVESRPMRLKVKPVPKERS